MKGTAAVIEDNQECQYLAKYLLEQAGYVVYCAGSGAEGIELAKRVQPGVVLLDIELPDMDGCAVVRLLRQTAGFEKTPVIALTAHAMVGDRERFLAAGCTGYIEKPIDPGSFVSSVEKHFGPERSAGPNVRPKRVLVVDDKQEGRYQLQVFLGSKGFEVLEAENGAEALQKAREQKPDLIVSDILMPVMDGFSLCRACKKDPELKSIPFIFYTATYTDPKDEELALSIGADRFIVKPVENEVFLQIISTVMREEFGKEVPRKVSPGPEVGIFDNGPLYLQQYNQALIRKLEDKVAQLESLRRELEKEIQHRKAIEQALRRREEYLSSIYEKMPVGYHSLDPEGRLGDVNPFWLQMFGYGREEVIGRLLTDFLTEPSRAAFEKEFSRFRDDSKVTAYEMEFRCKNGTIRTVAVQGVFVHDEQGRPLQGHCILQDISEHKRLESVRKALLSLARELSEAGSKVDVARCIFSTADRLWQWDAGALEMVNSDAFTGETVLAVDRIDGERREVSVQQMHSSLSPLVQQVVRTGPVLILRNEDETRAKDLTGLMEVGRMARSVMAVPVKHRGRVLAVISIQSYAGDAFDKEDLRILEGVADHCSGSLARVETTEKLRQSQNRLSLAIEGTGLGIWDWDLVTGRIVWEGHHARLFGLKPEEFDGTYAGFEARVHPEDREKIASAVKRALENREAYSCEYRVVWPDGSVHWIVGHGQFTYDDQGRAVRMVGVVRETTEQHLAEERLRESEQRFRSLYDNAVVGIYRTTPDGRILLANPAVVRMLGYSSFEELATLNLEKEGFHPQFPRKIFKEAVERNGYVHGLEGAWVRKDGSIVYVRESAQAIRDANGNILYYDGTVEDITEYLKARMELERQAALLEAATDAIHARTLDGTITYWNKASEAILGWDRGEAIGRKITALAVKDPVAFAAAEAALVEKGSWSGELQFTTKSGKTLTMFCRWTLVPAQGDRSPEVLAIQSDITEKRELELRFLRAQRLEGIGALASGIAHDLNNILAPIVMGVSLLRDKSTDPEFQSGLETIESSAQRGANIVRQLLTFARGLKGERMPIQLQHVVRDVGRLIRETFPRNITYREVCPGDLWPIIGDPTQIQQVLLNLCVNARDAMPAGGDLSITVSNKQVDRQFLCSVAPDVHEGPFVVIEVRDTGHGMTPDIMEHLFEPFFTTKEPGTGTGLGLATSLGIVRNHGGFIVVNSTPGEGSVFTVYLPASPEAMTPPAAEAQTAPIGKGEVILVVDDEASVREITKRTLEKHGYRVLVAEDGAAAVTLYANYRERIDVVLTDLLMPIMDGVGLATAIRRMDPKLPIIVSTGDPASPSQKAKLLQLEKLGVTVCLLKPYNTPQLLRTLHSVLHPS